MDLKVALNSNFVFTECSISPLGHTISDKSYSIEADKFQMVDYCTERFPYDLYARDSKLVNTLKVNRALVISPLLIS